MDLDEVVCSCQNVTNGMVKEAVDEGATTVEEVQAATDAGTVCGGCLDSLQQLIDHFTEEKDG